MRSYTIRGTRKEPSTDAYHTLFTPLHMHSRRLAGGILLIEKHSISFQFLQNWKEIHNFAKTFK